MKAADEAVGVGRMVNFPSQSITLQLPVISTYPLPTKPSAHQNRGAPTTLTLMNREGYQIRCLGENICKQFPPDLGLNKLPMRAGESRS